MANWSQGLLKTAVTPEIGKQVAWQTYESDNFYYFMHIWNWVCNFLRII